ncbi:MAG: ribosome silencing factor [[Eubacterium] sulci]|nr:ribosome silencing factor [[Eubacterium] sulci]MBF1184312.1 ribosome silencing factor [[Eubacterium] sulci]
MSSKDIAMKLAELLDSKKAEDIVVIDIAEKSSFADFLVVASGTSDRHIESLIDDVEDLAAQDGVPTKGIEGKNGTGWILLDLGDVIVNIFSREMRSKYNIEKVWADCEMTHVEE